MFFGLGHPGRQMLGRNPKAALLNSASLSLDFMTPGVLDPRITFTRASSGTYFDSAGVMQTAGYNLIRNNTQVGAVVGSPGTLPTNWIVPAAAGLTTQVIYAGADYIELRISGTPNNTLYTLNLDALTLTTGQLHTLSGYTALVGGTLTNVGSLRLIAGGSGGFNAPWNTTPTLTRVSVTWNATIASISPQLAFNTTVSAPVDLTVRLGLAQLEQAPTMSAVPTATTGMANGAPRWDYDPSTLQLKGLLLEDQRTNLMLQSADLSQAIWQKLGSVAAVPVVAADQTMAPDGTMTADSVTFPEVSAASAVSQLLQIFTATAAVYTLSVYLKGSVGGEQIYIFYRTVAYTVPVRVTLTTQWQRFVVTTSTLTAATWSFYVGCDLRDAQQTATAAQTFYMWGAQVELGDFATSYIPTVATAVTRNIDECLVPPANMGWFNGVGGSWLMEFDFFDNTPSNSRTVGRPNFPGGQGLSTMSVTRIPGQYDLIGGANATAAAVANAVTKVCNTWTAPSNGKTCVNGTAVGVGNTMTNGFAIFATTGIRLMSVGAALSTDNGNGHFRSMRYWSRILSDAEMQLVTA